MQVLVRMLDDAGETRFEVELDEPSRFDVDRDPLWVFARLDGMLQRAATQLHDQALQLNAARRS